MIATELKLIIETCISHLEEIGTPLSLPAKKTLASVGEIPDSMYIIKQGSVCTVRYTMNGNKRIFWNSSQVPISDPMFLAASVITKRPLTVDIVTDTAVKLIKIPRNDLMKAMSEDPAIGMGLSTILASRFMDVKGQFHESEESSFEQRFYELLLKYADQYGENFENKILIRTRISQQTMADLLHVDRTTVARCIKKLKDENLIERINDLYCIKNIDALKEKLEDLKEV